MYEKKKWEQIQFDFFCSMMMPVTHSDNNSMIDSSSIRGISPDVLVNMIHDTTEKLNNLTNDLNQSDEEICKINQLESSSQKSSDIILHPTMNRPLPETESCDNDDRDDVDADAPALRKSRFVDGEAGASGNNGRTWMVVTDPLIRAI